MELKFNNGGDPLVTVITMKGLEVNSHVTVLEDPAITLITPSFIANKAYTDEKFITLNVADWTIPVIPAANFISNLSGDVSAASTTSVNLLPQGTAGTYTVFTVNAKGLVTSGRSIVSNDLPNLNWSKITVDVGANDHGITDALRNTGSTLTGNLLLSAAPTSNNHASTKTYADNVLGLDPAALIQPGDLLLKRIDQTHPGFLRCNGAELSKTTYAALFAVVGDVNNIVVAPGVRPGTGQPWREQYDFNTEQSANITPWSTGTALPATVNNSQVIVTRSRVFLLGGLVNGTRSAVVYTAPINADGTLGTWTTTTSLPATLEHSQAVVINGSNANSARVFVLGGTNNNVASAIVYSAPINADGTLGTWTTVSPLPSNLIHSQAVVTRTRVFMIGGMVSGALSNVVYSAPINLDGTLGLWSTDAALPSTVAYAQAVVTDNKVLLLGGQVAGAWSAAVHTALINADGTLGTWSTTTPLPANVAYSQAVLTRNSLYLLGGRASGTNNAVVRMAPVLPDGTLGAWTIGTALPGTVSSSNAIVTQGRIHILGGFINGANSSVVYTAPFSGGFNDYADIYNSVFAATDPANFRLPDYTSFTTELMTLFIRF